MSLLNTKRLCFVFPNSLSGTDYLGSLDKDPAGLCIYIYLWVAYWSIFFVVLIYFLVTDFSQSNNDITFTLLSLAGVEQKWGRGGGAGATYHNILTVKKWGVTPVSLQLLSIFYHLNMVMQNLT